MPNPALHDREVRDREMLVEFVYVTAHLKARVPREAGWIQARTGKDHAVRVRALGMDQRPGRDRLA